MQIEGKRIQSPIWRYPSQASKQASALHFNLLCFSCSTEGVNLAAARLRSTISDNVAQVSTLDKTHAFLFFPFFHSPSACSSHPRVHFLSPEYIWIQPCQTMAFVFDFASISFALSLSLPLPAWPTYLPASVSLKIPSWLGQSSQLGITPFLQASQNQGSVEFSEAELMMESLSPSTP